jgi:hypothetical protein
MKKGGEGIKNEQKKKGKNMKRIAVKKKDEILIIQVSQSVPHLKIANIDKQK